MRQCIHLTLLGISQHLRLRLSVLRPTRNSKDHQQPPHSFLARKGFSRRFAAKLSHKQPGSRIVGLVIIIIIIHPNRRSTPTPTSPPCRLFGQPTLLSVSLNTKIRPAARHNCASTKTWWKDFALLMQCLHPMSMSMSLCLIELRKMRQSSASRRSGCAVGRRAVRDALANPLLCWHSVPTLTVVCQGTLLYYDLCQGAPFLLSSHPTSPDNYCGVFATLVMLFRPRSHCCWVANSRSSWPDAGAYFLAF